MSSDPAASRSGPHGLRASVPGRLNPVLLKEIRAVASEPVVLAPQDQAAEQANTNWFGAPLHERIGLSADEVVAVFEETAAALRDQVTGAGHRGTATFYVWHDTAAGQLRCSTCTRKPADLDFTVPYEVTDDLHAIVMEFIEDRAPGSIAWGELEPVPYPQRASPEPPTLAVWAYDLTPFGR